MSANRLTGRQIEILKHLAKGGTVKEFAFNNKLSVKTVESHIVALRNSLGITPMADLIHYAIRRGYVNLKSYDELGVSTEHRRAASDLDDNKANISLDS